MFHLIQPRSASRHFPLVATLCLLLSVAAAIVLLGFDANPSPQPQRVSDLVARLDALEETNAAQQAQLDALDARVTELEAGGGGEVSIIYDDNLPIPDAWAEAGSSDGVIRYRHDPTWELWGDEPGLLELWVDDENSLYFTWDWSYDLVNDIRNDKEYLRIFEDDLIWSDAYIQMDLERSGPIEFMGEDAYFWEISISGQDGYRARRLTIFYPCTERATCNVIRTHYDYDARGSRDLPEFGGQDWAFVNTFTRGIEFLSIGKATTTASANLRECPAIDCKIVDRLVRGEIIDPVAVSEDGMWIQLRSGDWISASLIFGAPADLPVIQNRDAM